MLNDVEYHSKINKDMKIVNEYLKNYYDPEYQQGVYDLIVDKLLKITNTCSRAPGARDFVLVLSMGV